MLGWRDVPTDDRLHRPERGRRRAGLQAGVHRPRRRPARAGRVGRGRRGVRAQALRHPQAHRARGRRARPCRSARAFYVVSLSSRTLIYKGMLTADQIEPMFPDLSRSETMESALALVHQRFSTNTFPSWPLAHPYRYVAHNGEINTLRGNINWMKAREALLRVRAVRRRPEEDSADHPRRRQRHGDVRQRARVPRDGRPVAAARRPDDDSRAVERAREHERRSGGRSTSSTRR